MLHHGRRMVTKSDMSRPPVLTATEIGAGAQTEQKLDLNGGNWCGFGHCCAYNEHGFGVREASFEPGDIIVVTYDVPRTNEATKMGIWYGVTASLTNAQ